MPATPSQKVGEDISTPIVKTEPESKKIKEKENKTPTTVPEMPMNTPSDISRELESKFYTKALKELENNKKDTADWARTLAEAEGDKEKQEAIYIKHRVSSLTEKHIEKEEKERVENEEKEKLALEKDRKKEKKIGQKEIRSEERARIILQNLGYSYDKKFDGKWTVNNKMDTGTGITLNTKPETLESTAGLFTYLVSLKKNLPVEFLSEAYKRSIGPIDEKGPANWNLYVDHGPNNMTFFSEVDSEDELRKKLVEALFLENT